MKSKNGINKSFITKSLISLVVIVIGVISGLYIAIDFGLVKWIQAQTLTPEDIVNNTNLKIDDEFPQCKVTDKNGTSYDITSLIEGKKSIVAIVSNGCEACLDLMYALDNNKIVPDDYQLILLSSDPEYFFQEYNYNTYKVPYEFLLNNSLEAYPTILVTSKIGKLRIICSGYTSLMSKKFIEQS